MSPAALATLTGGVAGGDVSASAGKSLPHRRKAIVPKADPVEAVPEERRRGRGVLSNPSGRFEAERREDVDDGWGALEELAAFKTEVTRERPKTIITRNESPDISFDRSINPYRGCEHGCVYCFARPTHSFMGLSAGLDFETRLFVKDGAADLLERELSAPNYQPKTIAIGTNTDPYQPIEKQYRVMRSVLEVLARFDHPVGIVTKSALVTRDIDLLGPMAAKGLAKVALSITTLDRKLARTMEPRASSPERRLDAVRQLSEAGIPTSVMVAPIIPAVTDHEIETILTRAEAMGAREAGYVMLRLPLEVEDLFSEWLLAHFPDKYRHVLSLVRSMRDGKAYDSTWGKRQTGTGPYAWMTGRRFEIACDKLGLNKEKRKLRTDLFKRPLRQGAQLSLF
ncbi:MAG: radical protein [Hyphomicrobiales bacterium]|nr:radical protein [Hyphomicrobiales bacterium]